MAVITAEGSTKYGDTKVTISNDENSKRLLMKCDSSFFTEWLKIAISNADGTIANGYHPPAWTMLQVYASLLLLFKQSDIKVQGDIGELECEEGVLY